MVIGCGEKRRVSCDGVSYSEYECVPTDNSGMPLSLSGLTVLVVEDEFLIALDTSQMLTDAGTANVSTARSCAEAVGVLGSERFDVVILDVHLHQETSFEVADLLADLATPYIFATGYSDTTIIPGRHAAALVIQKPFQDDELVRSIETAVGGPRAGGCVA